MFDIVKLEIIRNELLKAKFPPSYEDDKKKFTLLKYGTNCYAYVLQLAVYLVNNRWSTNYMPGFLSNSVPKDPYYTFEEIKNGIINDCFVLGIDIVEIGENDPLAEGSYRIALGYSAYGDGIFKFHVIRENQDKTWSEKRDWKKKPNNENVLKLAQNYFNVFVYFQISKGQELKLVR